MANPINSYYSNGKILLTGEYFVLKGAQSIALPVKYGQKLEVYNNFADNQIVWKAYKPDGLWFSSTLKCSNLEILQTNDELKSQQLVEIFKNIKLLNPDLLFDHSLTFETSLNFMPEWGLGTSSTLISNLAKWAGADPSQLNERSFKGSGFDIACASAKGPILYKKGKESIDVDLDFPFKDHLFFVYSGKKKTTKKEVQRFLSTNSISQNRIDKMNLLADKFLAVETLDEFQSLLIEHEQLVSEAIGIEPIYGSLLKDFKGAIKSLGAWGGDFFLAATSWDESKVRQYFKMKGFELIFKWDELILNRKNER